MIRHSWRIAFPFLAGFTLSACSFGLFEDAPPPPPVTTALPSSGAYPPQSEAASDLQCVPFARLISGMPLQGDAWTWWESAEDRFARGHNPKPGAILVLAKTDRLHFGHLAVVRDIVDRRMILVDHANWVKGYVSNAMRVADVSPDNDWSELRFFNLATRAFGAVYPAYGFIYREPLSGPPLIGGLPIGLSPGHALP